MIINLNPYYQYNTVLKNPVQTGQKSNSSKLLPVKNGFSGADILSVYNRVSFKGNDQVNPDLPVILEYLEEVRRNTSKIKSFANLDLDKIANICRDIPVFSNLTAKDLKLITTNFDSILLQRGCVNQCSHCGVSAESKITGMRWENFTDITDGIKTLKDRLGFNPFKSKDGDFIYPFTDSDPMIYRSRDLQGNTHSIFDAAKYFFDQTRTKFHITTAGWNKADKVAQAAVENFNKYPENLDGFDISVHPFHRYMQKSLKYKQEGNIEKSELWRNKYIDMISNVVKNTIELKDKTKYYSIILQYLDGKTGIEKEDSEKLLSDIFKKLHSEGVNLSYFTPYSGTYHTANVTRRSIGLIGKAAKYRASAPPELNAIDLEFNLNDLKKSAKMLGPDGKILIRPDCPSGNFNGIEFMELPDIKLNFRLPTRDLSTPLKKAIIKIR